MKRLTTYYFTLSFLLCLASIGNAQRNDAGLWESITLEKKLSPSILIEFQQSLRFRQNISRIYNSYYDIGLTFKLSKGVLIAPHYRYINRFYTENGTSNRHRSYLDIFLKGRMKAFILIYRHRFQMQFNDYYSREKGKIPSYYTRSKISVKYDLNRVSPYAATELYTKIQNFDNLLSNRFRIFAGFEIKINKLNEFELYYLFQRRFNEYNPLTDYVFGIDFKHRFY